MTPKVCTTHLRSVRVSMRGEMGERPHVRYAFAPHQVDRREKMLFSGLTTDAHEDLRYRFELPEEVPWKSLSPAVVLLAFGCLFLVISQSIDIENMEGGSSLAICALISGILIFLLGFYEARIAYYSWRGYKGYSYSRFPPY